MTALAAAAVAVAGVLVWRQADFAPEQATGEGAGRQHPPAPTATATTGRPRADRGPARRPATWPSPRATRGPRASTTAATHVFPIVGCETDYATAHHDYPATDVFAPRGCLFVSPVTGVVDEVSRVDRWDSSTNVGADRGGLSVSVVGADGVRYYGSHLEAVLPRVRPGLPVTPGTPLGRIGDTGSARGVGTHLHFAISWPTPPGHWWVRRGAVPPAAYLDAWKSGRNLSPAVAVAEARRAYGDDSRCHSYC